MAWPNGARWRGLQAGDELATIFGKAGRLLFQRFDDPQMERDYRFQQRTRQAKFTRAMTLIIGVAILAYVVTCFVFLRGNAFKTVGFAQIYFIPVLLGYASAVKWKGYVDSKWVDVFFLMAVQPGMYVTNVQMVQSGVNGWEISAQFCYSLLLAMAAGCLAFSASVGSYLALVTLTVFYYAGVLAFNGVTGAKIGYSLNSYITFIAVLFYVNWAIDDKARQLFKLSADLAVERAKSDRLLRNVLPEPIADRLRDNLNEQVADDFETVAVIFADIVGFTRIAKKLGSRRTVEMLNAYFSSADEAIDRFGLEKVKTIGDCYMAVAGALTNPSNPSKAAVDFSVFLVKEAHRVGNDFGLDLKVRVGINSGEVIGGVISSKRLSYDYWGDTINVSARLQGLAYEDGITVSQGVRNAVGDAYAFHAPRRVTLKNLGEADAYDVDFDLAPTQVVELAQAS